MQKLFYQLKRITIQRQKQNQNSHKKNREVPTQKIKHNKLTKNLLQTHHNVLDKKSPKKQIQKKTTTNSDKFNEGKSEQAIKEQSQRRNTTNFDELKKIQRDEIQLDGQKYKRMTKIQKQIQIKTIEPTSLQYITVYKQNRALRKVSQQKKYKTIIQDESYNKSTRSNTYYDSKIEQTQTIYLNSYLRIQNKNVTQQISQFIQNKSDVKCKIRNCNQSQKFLNFGLLCKKCFQKYLYEQFDISTKINNYQDEIDKINKD